MTKFVFIDEKLFSNEQAQNSHKDRIWSAEASEPSCIFERYQRPYGNGLGGIFASGKIPLIFVDQGIKIKQQTYSKFNLEDAVLPWSQLQSSLETKVGPSKRIPNLHIELKTFNIGARHIFLTSLELKNGYRIPQICCPFIALGVNSSLKNLRSNLYSYC